ncbi:glycosyltransferase family protein [Arcobacter peruensis]|uniref:glycosyltransferase family protein n=1 Tax=Arcobacter peruensis TaxID=2320140 RepID=UPI000F0918B4|nr:glycosyltransferase [Arcobacter peruensis]
MRIIHCAPFNILTKTGGSLYSNPIKISQGLTQNNHFVHNFDYRDTSRYLSVFRNKKNGQKKMNNFFKSLIDDLKPDLIIFGHAELILKDTFDYIKNKKINMIYWYNDVPIQKYFKEVAHYFDFILTTAGGDFIKDLKVYNKNTFFLPNLVDNNIEKHNAFKKENFSYDLLFSGRLDNERKTLVDFLNSNLNKNIKTKFIGQNKESVVIGEEYFSLIADSKICINHNRDFTLGYEWYTSDRLMHILGNGSFPLSTEIIGAEKFFEDKLECYTSYDELSSKIDYFLENEKERIDKSIWLSNRVHNLFNSKRVAEYILDLFNQDNKKLVNYEWYK